MVDIQIDSVSKTYNPGLFKKKIRAVSDLSLSVGKGEVFGLVGPNGAGKSSVIRMMLGLSRPDRGRIQFCGGHSLGSDIRNRIGYLPENPYLYDHLTLTELLRFGGRASGLSSFEIDERARNLLSKVNLEEAARRPLRTYSKGMKQRAGFCFALLHDPSIIILDEPMSGLDPVGRKLIFDIVCTLRDEGKTIFFCSHILSDVERVCSYIGLMSKGRLVRTFNHSDFHYAGANRIHLLTVPLDSHQEDFGTRKGWLLGHHEGNTVISLNEEQIKDAMEVLDNWKVKIVGTRSERINLENLFMDYCSEKNR